MVEQPTRNGQVAGSIPARGSQSDLLLFTQLFELLNFSLKMEQKYFDFSAIHSVTYFEPFIFK